MSFYRTWPTHWLQAAVKAGLAKDHGELGYWFESDEMRYKLEVFAEELLRLDRLTKVRA